VTDTEAQMAPRTRAFRSRPEHFGTVERLPSGRFRAFYRRDGQNRRPGDRQRRP